MAERKRSRMNILYDMLSVIIRKNGRIKPTHLMYSANLSHKQMKLYLDEMIHGKLVEFVEHEKTGKQMISITKKGKDFFFGYNQMKEFEKAFGL